MSTRSISYSTYGLLGILIILSFGIMTKGCDRKGKSQDVTSPGQGTQQGFRLKIMPGSDSQMKATGLTITATGLDEQGNPVEDLDINPLIISEPTFPLSKALTVYIPPCLYRLDVTVSLSRDAPRTASITTNICENSTIELSLDVFEEFLINPGSDPIQAPPSSLAGEAIVVSCGAIPIDAPDRDQYPLTAVLYEYAPNYPVPSADAPERSCQEELVFCGAIDTDTRVSGEFPDPFPVVLPSEESRLFVCTITDSRSEPQTFEKLVVRIPPTPTPTPTPTPKPTATPQPLSPTATPAPTQVIVDDATGNDGPADCGIGATAPCKTIQRGVDVAYANGLSTVLVQAGAYAPAAAITINDAGVNLTLQAQGAVTVNPGVADAFSVTANSNNTIQGFTINKTVRVNNGRVTLSGNSISTTTQASIIAINSATVALSGGNTINASDNEAIVAMLSANITSNGTTITMTNPTVMNTTAIYVNNATISLTGDTIQVTPIADTPEHLTIDGGGTANFVQNNTLTGSGGLQSISCNGGSTINGSGDTSNSTDGTIDDCPPGIGGALDCGAAPCTF